MKAIPISENVYSIHADIVTNDLFEGLWDISNGVTLNSYLVLAEKTAFIDLAKNWENSITDIQEQLNSISFDFSKVDYLVLNHLEPDHSDFLMEFAKLVPHAKIVTTKKGVLFIKQFFKLDLDCIEIKDGFILDLGGKRLQFFETPNVHWPETMMTYLLEDKILFSCDAFGSFGNLGERIFDDEFTAEEHLHFEAEALRYYASIVASFSPFVKKAIAKLNALDIRMVAPSHGMLWRREPKKIIDRYFKYASYNTDGNREPEVAIILGSMYGYTKKSVEFLTDILKEKQIPYSVYQVPKTDYSYVLASVLKASIVIVASPTYEYKMFPPVSYALELCAKKHLTGKYVLFLGNKGWTGGAKKEFNEKIETLKWTLLESYEWHGVLGNMETGNLRRLANLIEQKLKEVF